MLYAIVAVLIVILDQALKLWVGGNIALGEGIVTLIPGVMSLVNVQNKGAAFGFLSGANAQLWLIILCAVLVVVVIIALATNLISGSLGRWSAVCIMAGGVGNCIDRIINGYVQDMFKTEFIDFYIFNVADIFIVVFGILFILYVLFGGKKKRADDEEEDDEDEDEDEDDEEEDDAPPARIRRRAAAVVEAEPAKEEPKAETVRVAPARRAPKAEPEAAPASETRKWSTEVLNADAEASARRRVPSAKPVSEAAAPAVSEPAVKAEPVKEPVSAAETKSEFEFSLDDILNEFKS